MLQLRSLTFLRRNYTKHRADTRIFKLSESESLLKIYILAGQQNKGVVEGGGGPRAAAPHEASLRRNFNSLLDFYGRI